MKFPGGIEGKTRKNRVRNEIKKGTEIVRLQDSVETTKLKLYGRTMRMEEERVRNV